MNMIVRTAEMVTVGTEAQSVAINSKTFLMVNTSEANTVYFKEMAEDGKPVTTANGFALLPGQMLQIPLCARTLSVIATAADTDVRFLYLTEGL